MFDGLDAGVTAGSSTEHIELDEATRVRYLNYALSVITSRALPDVRDGLKPVQRRILYSMWQQGGTAESKHRKCAKVVGDVMGSFHPHGDTAIYDALVRMAQPFSLREPLIDGQGNFGSMDGDGAAAMRYTECRLMPIAGEILGEIDQNTVPFRPNYDATKSEPVVLPTRIPNLLVNGSTGIAVGMATNIPPHNLAEVCDALLALAKDNSLKAFNLCKYIKGPDFPTGGQILNTIAEIRQVYKDGGGAIKLRATYEAGPASRAGNIIYITSVPYTVNKATLVEAIGELAINRKLPQLLDVKDISTDDVRIEITLKKDCDEQKVMAYLFKNTPLQTNFNVNLTCLLPTDNPEAGRPTKCDLREILWQFLIFRLEVVTKRLQNELETLQRRIHILEGFATVFDALDQIIKLIRASEGKQDAAGQIMSRFKLDAEQTDAILELKLYRLAKLEILVILKDLEGKKDRANVIKGLLKSEASRWKVVQDEISEIKERYGKKEKRRTLIQTAEDDPEISQDDFIVAEDNHVLVTTDGWVKRQREIKDPATTRLREGDTILACFAGSTRATCAFFTNFGTAYTCRIDALSATTGYGEPIQKLFKLKDGEKVVAAFSLDPRICGKIQAKKEGAEPPIQAVCATTDGYSSRFSVAGLVEPSTRAGRRFTRCGKGAEVLAVAMISGTETLMAVTHEARALLCAAKEINFLSGPGRGVILIKVKGTDRVVAFKASTGDRDLLEVITGQGSKRSISTAKYERTSRGGRGREIIKRGTISGATPAVIEPPLKFEP